MAATFPYGSLPDATPSGLEQMSIKQAQAEAVQPLIRGSQQTSLPEPPQKRSRPEACATSDQTSESYRLKQELNNLRDEHAHLQSSMGKMAQDLVETEMQLESKQMLLQHNEAELLVTKKENEMLSNELAGLKVQRATEEKRASTVDQSTTSQMTEMQNKIETLSTALHEQSNVQQASEDVARLEDDNLQLTQSSRLKDMKVAQLQEELGKALGRINVILSTKGESSQDEDAVAAQTVRLKELQDMSDFYRSNSERLSGDIKIIRAQNSDLQQSLRVKAGEISGL
ncbi:hypothetical protein EG328_004699 [Venturia inaequalis]|uniref:Uncharacterized protein n=1 Tax=Venturia inaequalis TaxID=5025 RepID=A0A8H3UPA1_VENIN|nr:hypothetical protein EG328_004699 [Venturia inaequalis]RDI87050.1 hypothetical protein Vi05172_g2961 [Venturia inaequalis]